MTRDPKNRTSRASLVDHWFTAHQTHLLVALTTIAVALRALLAMRSPTPYGYVFDFYHEAIQKFYSLGHFPASTDCWQCYHPPLLTLLGFPLYALGKAIMGGPAGLADPALRFVAVLSLASAGVAAYYSYRVLRLFRFRGAELVIGTGLILALPCLFISSFGIEADILLTALMTAFLYYLIIFAEPVRPARYMAAVRLGALAGLACATKYSGLIAPAALVAVASIRFVAGPVRARVVRETAVALAVCALLGSWKYVDNLERYHTPLFANGSAQEGFAITSRPAYANTYDFHSLHLGDLMALNRGEIGPAHLTDLPFYKSVWTTLHAMAWGDMSMFSDPSRHGFFRQPYPRKKINASLASSVLVLGLLPDALAIIGLFVIVYRRAFWPLAVFGVLTSAVYAVWFLAQDTWALKTKYILFLLPVYVVYALLGWRWLSRRSPILGRVVEALLAVLIVMANLYLLDFAWT